MRLTDKAQIAVLKGTNSRNPFAMYVTEILETEGFCYQLVEVPEQQFDVLIVPDIELTLRQREAVEDLATTGSSLLGLRPSPELLPAFGLRVPEGSWRFTWADRYLCLRDHTVLQYHGPADLVELAGAEVLSWLQHDFEEGPAKYPAAVRSEEGGRRAAFTFDLVRSVVLTHQGRADQAGDGINPDPDGDGMFKPNDLFINHLDPRCKLVPQADVMQDLFVELIYWLTERSTPIPRLWHFPNGEPAIAFLTGDSDGGQPEHYRVAFETAESFGCKYTLYLMTQDFQALPSETAHTLTDSGHEVALHPWLSGMPQVAEFREHLRREFSGFQERYGYLPATVRNHSCIIAGWTDTSAIFSEIGLRMDLNAYSGRHFQYGFLTGTGLPMKLSDRTGRPIDIYQQTTVTSDDAMLEGKCNLPPHSIDETIAASLRLLEELCGRYHGVYQPCFHPVRMRSYPPQTIEWYAAVLEAVRSRNMLSVSGRQWCEFNDARRSVKIERAADSWHLGADKAVRGLTILWPSRVKEARINGQEHALQPVGWGGVEAGFVTVDVDPGETMILET